MTIKDQLARHFTKTPDTAGALFIAANATINGDVVLGPQTSVFYGVVLRGDIHEIRVGEGTNIQDNAIVHLADDYGAYIGKWCTIGHAAIVHACMIGDECLIGMGATSPVRRARWSTVRPRRSSGHCAPRKSPVCGRGRRSTLKRRRRTPRLSDGRTANSFYRKGRKEREGRM